MDPLEALGEDRPDPQEHRALRRPVAGRPGPVLAPGDDEEWRVLRAIAHRGVVDELLLAIREVNRVRTLPVRHELVAKPDVAERATHHHLVVTAPRAVRVELDRSHVALLEPFAAGRGGCDRPGRADVDGGHGAADD